MSDDRDGGPAFPLAVPELGYVNDLGMSLRDWLAGQAIVGNLAAMNAGFIDPAMAMEVAKGAYRVADAALEVRKVKT